MESGVLFHSGWTIPVTLSQENPSLGLSFPPLSMRV